jgi:hypothetical protein
VHKEQSRIAANVRAREYAQLAVHQAPFVIIISVEQAVVVLRDVADEERTREWMRPLRVLNLPLRSLTKLCKGSRDASPGVLLLLLVLLLLD